MDIKCLEGQLGSFQRKEKEFLVLAHQASGATQVLEYLIVLEKKALEDRAKAPPKASTNI